MEIATKGLRRRFKTTIIGDMGPMLTRLAQGPNYYKMWQEIFKVAEMIFSRRFATWAFEPKRRSNIHGNTPLRRGTIYDSTGRATVIGNRLIPSLTSRNNFSVREITRKDASFGTRFPWAYILNFGKAVAVTRIRIARRRRSLKWRKGNDPKDMRKYDDFVVGPGGDYDMARHQGGRSWQAMGPIYIRKTQDSGFRMPKREFFRKFTPQEIAWMGDKVRKNINQLWYEARRMGGRP